MRSKQEQEYIEKLEEDSRALQRVGLLVHMWNEVAGVGSRAHEVFGKQSISVDLACEQVTRAIEGEL